jgi:RNA polymerase sigma-70 factor (family 1)
MNNKESICEEKNYEFIYYKYSKLVHNYVYYKCGDPDLARDFVQEAFITLWNNCSKVTFEKAKAYLYTLTNNRFLNHVAHQKIRLSYATETTSNAYNIQSPEYILEEKEFGIQLQEAIAGLTVKQREVFLLNRIEKKKYAEIAEMLDISVKAVEQRMHSALLTLKNSLKKNL